MEGATTTLAVGLVRASMINDPTSLAFDAAESRPQKIDAATKASQHGAFVLHTGFGGRTSMYHL
jgi:hypothetical protein